MKLITKFTITFAQAGEAWLKTKRRESKPSTYAKYEGIYRKLLPDLGHYRIHVLTASKLSDYIHSFDNYSNSMQSSILCVITQILKYSTDHYNTPATTICLIKPKAYAKAPEVFDEKSLLQLSCFLTHNADVYKSAILLCLLTGLRIGEICALKWSDIDEERRILHVNSTVQRLPDPDNPKHTILMTCLPKSRCSNRCIPLPASAYKILLLCPRTGEYVVGGNNPTDPRTMQYRYAKYLKLCGISYKHFHILRHTFATNCIACGMDVKSLSEILGHANIKTTLNRYVHPAVETKRSYLDNLSEYYRL